MSIFRRLFSKSKAKEVEKNPFAIPGDLMPYKKYMAKNVPLLLNERKVFTPDFLSRYAAYFLKNGKSLPYQESDIMPGMEGKAISAYYECIKICSLHFSHIQGFKNARKVEARFITLKVCRKNKDCARVVKEKRYKLNENIPLYPCTDCDRDPMCDIWYKFVY